MSLKIVSLKSENFKKLKAIDITPKNNVVVISGRNGQGKSSVLDSILVALAGKQKELIKPIRDGEKKACISIDLGDYQVKRTFTEKGGTLEVLNKNAKYSSPQTMLDSIVGELSFDPLEFSKKNDKDQREILLKLCGIDLDTINEKLKEAYEKRRLIGVEGKNLTKFTEEEVKKSFEYKDAKEVSSSEIVAEIEDARKFNEEFENGSKTILSLESDMAKATSSISQYLQLIKDCEKLIENNKSLISNIKDSLAGKQIKDIGEIKKRLQDVESTNLDIRRFKEVFESNKKVDEKRIEWEAADSEYNKLAEEKKLLLEVAKMPIEGLEIGDDGVFFNKIPLSQVSTSEKLRVGMAIAMKMNPELRVIRILDGSLLDDDGLKIVEEMAVSNDFQIWIEKVDSSGTVGFYIEEGEIVNN